jgi:molybdate transport system permease protein
MMDWLSTQVSLALALATTLLLLPLGIYIARWLSLSQSRARALVEAGLLLPLLLPPTVLGFYWLNVFGKTSLLGSLLERLFHVSLVFTFEGLLFASLLINLPFMVQPIARSFEGIDHSLREAAWVGGLSQFKTFLKIELPLVMRGVIAGCAMTFAHTLGEFGVVLLVGGNIESKTRTLSIAIYDKVQAFDMQSAHLMALTLVLFSLFALVAVFATQKRPIRTVTAYSR